jgi:ubiquinone/menaquinone biosynthesis C-methylase UbiE
MTFASVIDGLRLDQPDPLTRLALDAARLGRGWRVLDVGCGTGTTSVAAADLVGQRGMVVGMDIDRESISLAAAWTTERREVTFVCDDAGAHPFEVASFDAVISRFGLSRFADPDRSFSQLGRVVRPHGRIGYVTTADPVRQRELLLAAGFADLVIDRADAGVTQMDAWVCSGTRGAA